MTEASDQRPGVAKKAFALVIALCAYASIGLQYYYSDFTTLSFFSYFTTLCNLLVAFTLTCLTVAPQTNIGRWSSKLTVQTALVTYISIVSLVYNVALRGNLEIGRTVVAAGQYGTCRCSDPLHNLLAHIQNQRNITMERWIDLVAFSIVLSHLFTYQGAMINWYPYPFLNAFKFGYGQVSVNILVMLAVFLGAGLIFIRITRSSKA